MGSGHIHGPHGWGGEWGRSQSIGHMCQSARTTLSGIRLNPDFSHGVACKRSLLMVSFWLPYALAAPRHAFNTNNQVQPGAHRMKAVRPIPPSHYGLPPAAGKSPLSHMLPMTVQSIKKQLGPEIDTFVGVGSAGGAYFCLTHSQLVRAINVASMNPTLNRHAPQHQLQLPFILQPAISHTFTYSRPISHPLILTSTPPHQQDPHGLRIGGPPHWSARLPLTA